MTDSKQDKHVKKVLTWRENLSVMSENRFFELLRMYLGEVKTPYNKQKLIEDLSVFLRKEENQKNIVGLLSETDLQIISVVYFLPGISREKLGTFFNGILSFAALYDRLINLEERLILFAHKDPISKKTVIDTNPLLDKAFLPLLKIENILPLPTYAEKTENFQKKLTPLLFASFLAYVSANPDICKNDGDFKKRAIENLAEIFPGCDAIFKNLDVALINLAILKEGEKGFSVDWKVAALFANLSWKVQVAYLSAAAAFHTSRTKLKEYSQILMNALVSIPKSDFSCGYAKSILIRSGLFLNSTDEDENSGELPRGRFSKMLERNSQSSTNSARVLGSSVSNSSPIAEIKNSEDLENQDQVENPLEKLIEPALAFGFFEVAGKTETGEEIIVANSDFLIENNLPPELEHVPKVLSIDSGFSVTLLPGLELKNLLPLVQFMEITRYDSVATFELTKKSIFRALDSGYDSKKIFDIIEENSQFSLPQNLRYTIEEWCNIYNSATLYSGFVLKVTEENKILTQKNPNLKKHIKEVLAPGVFWLDVKNAAEAQALLTKCGTDFIGKIKTAEVQTEKFGFLPIGSGKNLIQKLSNESTSDNIQIMQSTEEQRATFLNKLRKELDEMNVNPEQKSVLKMRINRKIVVNSAQLRPNSVRIEKNEAFGMDYTGKIRLVEKAIENKNMIEISVGQKLVDGAHDSVPPRIFGTPLSLERLENDTNVHVKIEPSQEEMTFSLAQAEFVRRIRGSFLEEN